MTVTREADIAGRTYAIEATASPPSVRVTTGAGSRTYLAIGSVPVDVACAAAQDLDLDRSAALLLLTAIRSTLAEARRRVPLAWSVAS